VCRRWRSLVFGSPRRLNLHLLCTPETLTKDTLDIWPALPLLVVAGKALAANTDNVIAALGQNNRVRDVHFWDLANRHFEKVLVAMQVPFPELTSMWLMSHDKTLLAIPDSFLGGSAPRLRSFTLSGIPFPGLPKLLLSATHLVTLQHTRVPHSGYISPEAIVALISVLSSLEILSLGFESPQSRPDGEGRNIPPPERSIVLALTCICFRGVTEYLEELVTRIDTPQLDNVDITFLSHIGFDCPRLVQFIDRTPKLRALGEVWVQFDDCNAFVKLRSRTSDSSVWPQSS
jgi:hypothetical protein